MRIFFFKGKIRFFEEFFNFETTKPPSYSLKNQNHNKELNYHQSDSDEYVLVRRYNSIYFIAVT